MFGPNGPIKKKYTYLRRILLGQGGLILLTGRSNGASPRRFGARLGSLWVSVGDFWSFWSLEDHFEIIVESLWVYEGPLSKNIHFPDIFQSFYKTTGWILVDSGLLWGHFGHMKLTLGQFWAHFGATVGI